MIFCRQKVAMKKFKQNLLIDREGQNVPLVSSYLLYCFSVFLNFHGQFLVILHNFLDQRNIFLIFSTWNSLIMSRLIIYETNYKYFLKMVLNLCTKLDHRHDWVTGSSYSRVEPSFMVGHLKEFLFVETSL